VTRPCVACGRCGARPDIAGRHGVAQHFQHRKSARSSHLQLKSSKSVETIGGHSKGCIPPRGEGSHRRFPRQLALLLHGSTVAGCVLWEPRLEECPFNRV
jgi:hypothetical protein